MKRWADGVFAPAPPAPLPMPAAACVRALEPLVVDERRERIAKAVEGRVRSVVAVIEGLSDPHNASAILRTSDALGVHEVHAIEAHAHVRMTTRVTKGAEKWMDLRRHSAPEPCANELRARGYKLYVADMRATVTLEQIAEQPRVALAFGNEHAGISPSLRAASDGAFAIPMTGMVESFNVSVAAGIALYVATRGRRGDLTEDERAELHARFLLESVRGGELVLERALEEARAAARRNEG
ncbi:MAG: RNA methyltransferase [Myxococcales bacterium]|nr:RNA methyltransferase [Myxococcales bacterium]